MLLGVGQNAWVAAVNACARAHRVWPRYAGRAERGYRDGQMDLVVANWVGPLQTPSGSVSVYLNQGSGAFTATEHPGDLGQDDARKPCSRALGSDGAATRCVGTSAGSTLAFTTLRANQS